MAVSDSYPELNPAGIIYKNHFRLQAFPSDSETAPAAVSLWIYIHHFPQQAKSIRMQVFLLDHLPTSICKNTASCALGMLDRGFSSLARLHIHSKHFPMELESTEIVADLLERKHSQISFKTNSQRNSACPLLFLDIDTVHLPGYNRTTTPRHNKPTYSHPKKIPLHAFFSIWL